MRARSCAPSPSQAGAGADRPTTPPAGSGCARLGGAQSGYCISFSCDATKVKPMARLTPLILCSAVWACDAFNPCHVALRPRAYRLRAEQRADNADAVAAPDAIAAVELADAPRPSGRGRRGGARRVQRRSIVHRGSRHARVPIRSSVALVAAVLALSVCRRRPQPHDLRAALPLRLDGAADARKKDMRAARRKYSDALRALRASRERRLCRGKPGHRGLPQNWS